MRAYTSAGLVCCIVAFLLVMGCTAIMFQSPNVSFNGNGNQPNGLGGVPPGGGSGSSAQQPDAASSGAGAGYWIHLTYKFTDKTTYPDVDNFQTCGSCDSITTEAQSAENDVNVHIDGPLGRADHPMLYNPYALYTISLATDPGLDIMGTNYERNYQMEKDYSPKGGPAGCQGGGPNSVSGSSDETVTSGSCKNINVQIPGVNDPRPEVIIGSTQAGHCMSNDTYKTHGIGKNAGPDHSTTTQKNTDGEYNVVCEPLSDHSSEADQYFFNPKNPGEATSRDFTFDSNGTYVITCSGEKEEQIQPACSGCDSQRCWPGGEVTRHQERYLQIILTPKAPEHASPLVPLVPSGSK
jgi:hypothetical protein